MLLSAIWLSTGGVATAQGEQATATAGSTTATLSWRTDIGLYDKRIHLHVERAGAVALKDATVVHSVFGVLDNSYAPAPVQVVDLDGDSEPEVVVTVYTGGASCCFGVRVYRWNRRTYAPSQLLGLGGLYRIDRLGDGSQAFAAHTEFLLAGPHSCAGYPVQLIAYRRGSFSDVTNAHPQAVSRDARQWKRRWPRRCGNGPAIDFLGAYLIDLHRLGQTAASEQAIDRARSKGYFDAHPPAFQVTEQAFRRALARAIAHLSPQYLPD